MPDAAVELPSFGSTDENLSALPAVGKSDRGISTIEWIFLAAVVGLIVFVRWRLLSLPLERDEGEYAYGAQLLQSGGLLYRDLHSMKWPGIYAAYSLIFSLLGETREAIHSGLLVINLLSAFGMFLLAREFLKPRFAAWAAIVFLVLTVLTPAHGIIANAEHFAMLWPIFGWWLLSVSLRQNQWVGVFLAGCLLGMGPVMKQHALFFVVAGGVLLLATPFPRNFPQFAANSGRAAIYSLGAVAVWLAMLAAVRQQGVWSEFWLWTVQYPADYTSQITLHDAPLIFLYNALSILKVAWPIALLAVLGLYFLWKRGELRSRIWAIGLLLSGLAAICPGFYFRPHYFLLLMPSAALLAGFGLAAGNEWFSGHFHVEEVPLTSSDGIRIEPRTLLFGGAILLIPLVLQSPLLIGAAPRDVSRAIYGSNPFAESPQIAEYLRTRTSPDDHIAILGSEPEICFEADRRLAGGFVYMYPLMERQPLAETMQRQMIEEVTAARPPYAVLVAIHSSWLGFPDSNPTLTNWMPEFLRSYVPCGLVWIRSPQQTDFILAKEGEQLDLTNYDFAADPNRVVLYRRRDVP